jgi:serine/threonine protein kinase
VYLSKFLPEARKRFLVRGAVEPNLEFGQREINGDCDLSNSPDWLWKCRGQLLVISTPYLTGKHYATSPLQLLALVFELEQLHRQGYVHGDIRGFNVVFQEGATDRLNPTFDRQGEAINVDWQGFRGHLIDYDFAGTKGVETTKYPAGYQMALEDAHRLGESGNPIVEEHEWLAIAWILFRLHSLEPPIGTKKTMSNLLLASKLYHFPAKFAAKAADTDEIQDLKWCLYSAHEAGWSVTPHFSYQHALIRYGWYVQPGPSVIRKPGEG